MKSLIFSLIVAASVTTLRADYLYWTVDFVDDCENIGKMSENPLEEGSASVRLLWGGGSYSADGGTITDDFDACIDLVQTDITNPTTYKYYVELYSGSETLYRSTLFNGADLARYFTPTPLSTPSVWNAAVGATWIAVPEPTSGLLMLIGIAGLALRRRRQA